MLHRAACVCVCQVKWVQGCPWLPQLLTNHGLFARACPQMRGPFFSKGAAERAHQAQVRALEAKLRQVTASQADEAEREASSAGQRLQQQTDNVARLEVCV